MEIETDKSIFQEEFKTKMKIGLLTFHAVSSAVIDIPGYVNKLTQTGLFSSVDYSGYQYQDGEYTLDLSCILKAIDAGGDKE